MKTYAAKGFRYKTSSGYILAWPNGVRMVSASELKEAKKIPEKYPITDAKGEVLNKDPEPPKKKTSAAPKPKETKPKEKGESSDGKAEGDNRKSKKAVQDTEH